MLAEIAADQELLTKVARLGEVGKRYNSRRSLLISGVFERKNVKGRGTERRDFSIG